jgi:hypothetical protein
LPRWHRRARGSPGGSVGRTTASTRADVLLHLRSLCAARLFGCTEAPCMSATLCTKSPSASVNASLATAMSRSARRTTSSSEGGKILRSMFSGHCSRHAAVPRAGDPDVSSEQSRIGADRGQPSAYTRPAADPCASRTVGRAGSSAARSWAYHAYLDHPRVGTELDEPMR